MPLGGDLKNINLADIFQTLSMNQRVGTLVVSDGVKEKRIFFSGHGVSLVSGRTVPGFRLGRYLLACGKITEEGLRHALSEQQWSGKLLGQLLVDLELCTEGDVDEVIRYHAAEELYEIFTWQAGEFEFLEGTSAEPQSRWSPYARIEFDAGGIVMEAARRIDEWQRFREVLSSDTDFLTRKEEGELPTSGEWGPDHTGVLSLVDGTRTVKEILNNYHLAAFDTAMVLRDLVLADRVHPATSDELKATARHFLGKNEFSKATRCLERARDLDPDDGSVIEQLADTYERLDEKRAAARCLVELGTRRFVAGQPQEALLALEKAEKYDPGSEEAPILLIRVLKDLDRPNELAEKARSAASILCDKQEFQQAIDLCQVGLASAPDHIGLEILSANAYLGNGEKGPAIDALATVAATLERSRSYRKLEEIYRKILQLDPSRHEFVHRLKEIEEGQVRRKKRRVKIGVMAACAVFLLLLSFRLFTSGMSAEEKLSRARDLLRRGDLTTAEDLAHEVVKTDPEADTAFQAKNLLSEIGRRRKKTSSSRAKAEDTLTATIEKYFSPASDDFQQKHFSSGIKGLAKLSAFFRSPECRALEKQVGPQATKRTRTEYRKSVANLLTIYADSLDAEANTARGEMTALGDVKIEQAKAAGLRDLVAKANGILDQIDPEPRRHAIETARRVEKALVNDGTTISARLEKTSAILDQIHATAEKTYHTARAKLKSIEIRKTFDSEVVEKVSDLENSGDIDGARAICQRFLVRCEKLRTATPTRYYAPAVRTLLGVKGLNLDGKTRQELDVLDEIKASLAKAEDLVEQGQYEASNALLRELVRNNFRIDFRHIVRLSLFVKSLPPDATVTCSTNGAAPRTLGTTGTKGLLVRYPLAGTTVVTVEKKTFEPARFKLAKSTGTQPAAPVVHLNKVPEWSVTGCGPVQATPVRTGKHIIVTSRDGHIRGFTRSAGTLEFDYDIHQLSGFSSPPLVRGDHAWLASLDGHLIDMDVKSGKITWTGKTDAGIRTPPSSVDGTMIVADEEGTVYGYRNRDRVWSHPLNGRVQGDPVAFADSLVVGTTEGVVARLSARTGAAVWSRTPGGRVYAALASDKKSRIVLGTDASEVICLSYDDGHTIWRVTVDNSVRGRPAVGKGRVFAATLSGTLYVIDLATGKVLRKDSLPGGAGVVSGIAIGDHDVYLCDEYGVLHAVSPECGPDWSLNLGARSISTPLVSDGYLYVATEEGRLICFRE